MLKKIFIFVPRIQNKYWSAKMKKKKKKKKKRKNETKTYAWFKFLIVFKSFFICDMTQWYCTVFKKFTNLKSDLSWLIYLCWRSYWKCIFQQFRDLKANQYFLIIKILISSAAITIINRRNYLQGHFEEIHLNW